MLLSSEIQWEQLNPARGDKSPQAGTIYGDRKGTEPTGFLVKFVNGFSSPPHIHNVTYRGVVISGLVHNDDEAAEKMWMPAGSFWTQPVGQLHITAAKGDENIAFIEIDNGPYLVKPAEEKFDNGERPVNIDASNIVCLSVDKTTWTDKDFSTEQMPEVALLWGSFENEALRGTMIKLPKGFEGKLQSQGSIFHSVVIKGALKYQMPNKEENIILDAGSYFGSENEAIHELSADEEVVIYIRTNDSYSFK